MKMKFRLVVTGIFLFIFSAFNLSQSLGIQPEPLEVFSGEKGIVRISGGTAHIPVMREAAARIMKFNPDIRITIAGGGSGAGIRQAGAGLVDIGNSGRRATDDEISRYDLRVFELAVDGVAVIVNPRNPVGALSSPQLQGIYSGRIRNWSELGGDDKPITIYTRDNSSGTRAVFWEKALGKSKITEKAHFTVSNGAMKAAVSQDPNGVGYVSAGHVDQSVKAVSFEGVDPLPENIRDGEYRISRKLYANTRGEPGGLARKFIEYLLGGEGQAIFEEKGFIPIK